MLAGSARSVGPDFLIGPEGGVDLAAEIGAAGGPQALAQQWGVGLLAITGRASRNRLYPEVGKGIKFFGFIAQGIGAPVSGSEGLALTTISSKVM